MLRWELGAITIDRIIETEGPDPYFDPVGFFPKTAPDDRAPHRALARGASRLRPGCESWGFLDWGHMVFGGIPHGLPAIS
jgi:hypothetical protein